MPHPIVGFGKVISFSELRLNKGRRLIFKGAFMTVLLIGMTWLLSYFLLKLSENLSPLFATLIVFFSLSGKTLSTEVRLAFMAAERSVEDGRRQVSRIVGRDTSSLSEQQVKRAALETLAENLSDGVIAPLFWYLLLGAPGMIAYKMVNTLDSMVGYKNERYIKFGKFSARVDDVANYFPARITAAIMLLVSWRPDRLSFVEKYGKCHTSPNSGYPEAALAAILDCRFGGPNHYFGTLVEKPYIGENDRCLTREDLSRSLRINGYTEIFMLMIVVTILIGLTSCPGLYL